MPPAMRFVAVVVTALLLCACGEGNGDAPADVPQQAPPPRAAQTTGGSKSTLIEAPSRSSAGGGTGADACEAAPADRATVSSFVDTLPYAPPDDAARADVVTAIVKTCSVFTPAGFTKRHCWAHLAAAIHKESAYDPTATVNDAYARRAIAGGAKANDPTVGLLQIRFSSTVHDYASYGPRDALGCAGCTLPPSIDAHLDEDGSSPFWAASGPAENMSMMTTPACNVALGAWYYYVNATGNGDASKPTYIADYCAGAGDAANVVTGLRSHLEGPSAAHGVIPDMSGLASLASTDPGSYDYVTTIKGWFDGMIGPSTGTHPFFLRLAPSPAQYCK